MWYFALFISSILGACIPYTLDNECYTFTSNYYDSTGIPANIIYNLSIGQLISDSRMISPAQCRRSLIWYLCSLAFPPCNSSCSIDQPSCNIINTECMGIYNLSCSSLPTDCNRSTDLVQVINHPIPVETCWQSENTTIPCCTYPFIKNNEEECVSQCGYNLPYFFEHGYGTVQVVCQILFYIFVWSGLGFLIFVFVPLLISF